MGQNRLTVRFQGQANHAGTTPMHLRRDAMAAAAEWIAAVERETLAIDGLVATVGRVNANPGAVNVIAGTVEASLDLRHAINEVRTAAVTRLVRSAEQIGARRGITVSSELHLDQGAVPMDPELTNILQRAAGGKLYRMTSGAGHDAMIVARRMPAAMLFLRSPGGISHHPDETVLPEDVATALAVGIRFLECLEAQHG